MIHSLFEADVQPQTDDAAKQQNLQHFTWTSMYLKLHNNGNNFEQLLLPPFIFKILARFKNVASVMPYN